MRPSARAIVAGTTVAVVAGALLTLGACESDQTVVRYSHFFDNIPSAQTGITAPSGRVLPPDPGNVPEDQLIEKDERGNITLHAKAFRHVMMHLARTLNAGEDDLLYQQVISQKTKDRLVLAGQDPHDALKFVKDNKDDILALFGRMPAAENTPGVRLVQNDAKEYCLALTGTAAKGMRFTRLWIVLEKGEYRFEWVQ